MVQHRPLSIDIHISLDPEGMELDHVSDSPSSGSEPSGRALLRRRLLSGGEDKEYAQEHSARIWNDAHPEKPVATSFDKPDAGFKPRLLPEVPKFPDYKKSVYSSGRLAKLPEVEDDEKPKKLRRRKKR